MFIKVKVFMKVKYSWMQKKFYDRNVHEDKNAQMFIKEITLTFRRIKPATNNHNLWYCLHDRN